MKLPWISISLLAATIVYGGALRAQAPLGSFLVTNDDQAPPLPTSATFYTINADGTLAAMTTINTRGIGIGGGFFAAARTIVTPNGTGACAYVSTPATSLIAGIDAMTHTVTGTFSGSGTDSGFANGIGLAANAQYLYATYTSSTTIGAFRVQPGCTLTFLGDVFAAGLNGGVVNGMAVQGKLMVVTYGDGSIESFDISGGVPVSNGDEQVSTGFGSDDLPNGVAITQDGHYAIFGDASTVTTVEVSDISSGKLTPTIGYVLGKTWNSGNVRLSPDGTVLFISNESAGQVTAAFFNGTTGKVTHGCTSGPLRGYYTDFSYVGNVGLQLATGTGGVIYVPEFGSAGQSYLGLLEFTSNGTTCTLTESASSPVTGSPNSAVLSIAAYSATQ